MNFRKRSRPFFKKYRYGGPRDGKRHKIEDTNIQCTLINREKKTALEGTLHITESNMSWRKKMDKQRSIGVVDDDDDDIDMDEKSNTNGNEKNVIDDDDDDDENDNDDDMEDDEGSGEVSSFSVSFKEISDVNVKDRILEIEHQIRVGSFITNKCYVLEFTSAEFVESLKEVLSKMKVSDYHTKVKFYLLRKDKKLKHLYDVLVSQNAIITDEMFWRNRKHLIRLLKNGLSQPYGYVINDIRPSVKNNQLEADISSNVQSAIFNCFPQVRKAYYKEVPTNLDRTMFWKKFLQNYFKKEEDSTFVDYNQEVIELSKRYANTAIVDKAIDLRKEDYYFDSTLTQDNTFSVMNNPKMYEYSGLTANYGCMDDYRENEFSRGSNLSIFRRYNSESRGMVKDFIDQRNKDRVALQNKGLESSKSFCIEDEHDDMTFVFDRKSSYVPLEIEDQKRYFERFNGDKNEMGSYLDSIPKNTFAKDSQIEDISKQFQNELSNFIPNIQQSSEVFNKSEYHDEVNQELVRLLRQSNKNRNMNGMNIISNESIEKWKIINDEVDELLKQFWSLYKKKVPLNDGRLLRIKNYLKKIKEDAQKEKKDARESRSFYERINFVQDIYIEQGLREREKSKRHLQGLGGSNSQNSSSASLPDQVNEPNNTLLQFQLRTS